MYDEEAIYQEDDILQAQYEAESRDYAYRLRRFQTTGKDCPHGSYVSYLAKPFYPEQVGLKPGEMRCNYCKEVMPDPFETNEEE